MRSTELHIKNNLLVQVAEKLKDYHALVKFRLSTFVVFSAAIGFVLASQGVFATTDLIVFIIGGALITGASNALNQVIEKETDKLMARTQNRPIPSRKMSLMEASLAAGLMGIGGVVLLWFCFNPVAALLGALSLFSYAFIYTPLKRVSPIAVFVGAFPGAIPPVIGWVAVTGQIAPEALLIFALQFAWQFPHFWAIAWVAHDDYKKGGFSLLPAESGKSKASAIHVVIWTALLIPLSLVPFNMGVLGVAGTIVIATSSFLFLLQAINLLIKCTDKAARQLMFGSFAYLPIVLIALLLG